MKLKNIAVGDFVQVKKSMCHSKFKAKQVCEVIDINLTNKHGFNVLIQGKNYLNWVDHEHLKKPEPQLKQLDQSVFNNMHERWKFAAIDADGRAYRFNKEVSPYEESFCYDGDDCREFKYSLIGKGYDTSNWRNSLIEREPKPQLKKLEQSVFDGLDEKWRFAVIQNNGVALICTKLPFIAFGDGSWDWNGYSDVVGKGYDTSNWRNSLIERDVAKELTGNELCKAILDSGANKVLVRVTDHEDVELKDTPITFAYKNDSGNIVTEIGCDYWAFITPINNQGEPLTAKDVGL